MAYFTKTQFESQHFLNAGPDAFPVLDRALRIDPQNIRPRTKGPWIATIQAALNDLQAAGRVKDMQPIRDAEIASETFGDDTIAAVRAYKRDRDIRRPGVATFDDIVGRSTLANLDEDIMALHERRGRLVIPEIETRPIQDIVIFIEGFGGGAGQGSRTAASELLRHELVTPEYLAKNRLLTIFSFVGSGDHRNPGSEIIRLSKEILKLKKAGLVCLFGISAGGKNVLEIANRWAGEVPQAPLTYVGIADGAFFDPPDTVSAPPFAVEIRSGGLPNVQKVNFFQLEGNGTAFSRKLGRLFHQGKMDNGEVHGPVQGFDNRRVKATSDNPVLMHVQAVEAARPIIKGDIRRLLRDA